MFVYVHVYECMSIQHGCSIHNYIHAYKRNQILVIKLSLQELPYKETGVVMRPLSVAELNLRCMSGLHYVP